MARTKFGAAVKWGVIGAGATWLLDPDKGAERREMLRERVMGAAKQRKDELSERFSGSTSKTTSGSGNGYGTGTGTGLTTTDAGVVEPLPDRIAEEVQLESGAPGGPSVAPPTS